MFELMFGLGGAVAAVICGWLVWRFVVLPGAEADVDCPLASCDTSMLDEIKDDAASVEPVDLEVSVPKLEEVKH